LTPPDRAETIPPMYKLMLLLLFTGAGCYSGLDKFHIGSADAGADAVDQGCGAPGESCCAGTSCNVGAICSGTTCQACGAPDQPCCGGGSCNAGAMCQGSSCVACGGAGEACCTSGAACNADYLSCSNGRCSSCVAQVAVGVDFACVRKTDGSAWCWGDSVGDNYFCQLGNGQRGITRASLTPLRV